MKKVHKKENLFIALGCVSVLVLTFVVYLPALGNGFVNWDDPEYVYKNLNIRSLDLRWVFTAVVSGNWHPVTMLSHTVDYSLWGLDPRGHHLTSIVLHSLNSGLVFALSVLLIRKASGERPSSAKTLAGALVAALLFGLHPIHVESVAWISERKDVLSAFFYIIAIIFYVRYSSSLSRKPFYYLLALFIFLLALLSKPMAVSLPLVLLILDFYPLGRLRENLGRAVVEKIPFFLMSGLAALATLFTQKKAMALIPLSERMVVAMKGYVFYIYKTFFPAKLAPFYPRPVEASFLSLDFLGAVLILLVISAFCVVLAGRRKIFVSVWLYYLVTLLPVIGIVQVGTQAAADRYMYLPSVSLFVLIGGGAGAVFEKFSGKKFLLAFFSGFWALIFIILSLLTVGQTAVWKDSVTLWSYDIELFKDRADLRIPPEIVHYNLGEAYDSIGEHRKAIELYAFVISENPAYVDAYINRGVAYGELGLFSLAIEDFNRGVGIAPENPKPYLNRGTAYLTTGRALQAISDFQKTISLDPDNAIAYYNLGLAHIEAGEREEGIRNISKAAELGLREAKEFLAGKSP